MAATKFCKMCGGSCSAASLVRWKGNDYCSTKCYDEDKARGGKPYEATTTSAESGARVIRVYLTETELNELCDASEEYARGYMQLRREEPAHAAEFITLHKCLRQKLCAAYYREAK